MHRLTEREAIDAAKQAVRTERDRFSGEVEDGMADLDLTVADVHRAIKTSTQAHQGTHPEFWELAGGQTTDGDALIVEVEILDNIVRIVRLRGAEGKR